MIWLCSRTLQRTSGSCDIMCISADTVCDSVMQRWSTRVLYLYSSPYYGTLKTCHNIRNFIQSTHGVNIKLVFTLIPNKTTMFFELFAKLRQAISDLNFVFDPDLVVTDFEAAVIEAL